jgi:signal transduction histidine kinase
LSQALTALRRGDLELAQAMLLSSPGSPHTLGEVFRLYQAEVESQAMDLRDNQRRAEHSLDWFAQLFRNLPIAALLVDGRGMVVDANQMAMEELKLLAQPLPRTPQLSLRRLMADVDSEARLAQAQSRVNGSRPFELDDVRLRTADGELRWADLRLCLAPAGDNTHDHPGVLCLIHDRTDQIAAAEALEITARAQAERERDLAQAASQAKTQLLSRVSHELRTPLNAVIGFSELLLTGREPLSPQAHFKLQHIKGAGHQLLALVDEVLQFNMAETGQLRHVPARLDLGALVRNVAEQLEPLATAAQVSIDTTIPVTEGRRPLAWADPKRVREILNNLVSNAIKYNRPGGSVTLGVVAGPDQLEVSVADTGHGMTQAQISHLFEPFNRLGAEKGRTQGYGLGLSISRSLAVAMGGGLQVRSKPGEGSLFLLTLPALKGLGAEL